MLPALHSDIQRVKDLLARSDKLPDDYVVASHWARYLTIVAAGLLESGIRIILTEYAKKCASPSVCRYVESQLNGFQNPSSEKIVIILSSFDPSWAAGLASYWDGERKDAISSIMATRHQVAHGRNTGITLGAVTKYVRRAIEVLEFICQMIHPDSDCPR